MLEVVCGLVFNEGKIFIAQRKEGRFLAGLWEFPGGKIEAGENEENALIRELNEEFEMKVKILDRLGSFQHSYDTFDLSLVGFSCQLIKWNGRITVHKKVAWVHPEELENYMFAEADLPFVNLIRNNNF